MNVRSLWSNDDTNFRCFNLDANLIIGWTEGRGFSTRSGSVRGQVQYESGSCGPYVACGSLSNAVNHTTHHTPHTTHHTPPVHVVGVVASFSGGKTGKRARLSKSTVGVGVEKTHFDTRARVSCSSCRRCPANVKCSSMCKEWVCISLKIY